MTLFENYRTRIIFIIISGLLLVSSITAIAVYSMYQYYFNIHYKDATRIVRIYERTFEELFQELNYLKIIDFSKSDKEIVKAFQKISEKLYDDNSLINGVTLIKQFEKKDIEKEYKNLRSFLGKNFTIRPFTDVVADGKKAQEDDLHSIIIYREPVETKKSIIGLEVSSEFYRNQTIHNMNTYDRIFVTPPVDFVNNKKYSAVVYFPLYKNGNYYKWYASVPFTYEKIIKTIMDNYNLQNYRIEVTNYDTKSYCVVCNYGYVKDGRNILKEKIKVANQTYEITISVDCIMTFERFWQPILGFISGIIFIIFIGYYLYFKEQKEIEIASLEIQLEEAQKFASVGHFTWYLESGKCVCSDEFMNILGIENNQISIGDIAAKVYRKDLDIFHNFEKSLKSMGDNDKGEFNIRIVVDDEIKWTLIKYKTIVNKEDTVAELFGTVQDITKFKDMENTLKQRGEEFKRIAITDHLTRVYNRVYLEEQLSTYFEEYKRYKKEFTVVILDIDHFKNINDKHGHQEGDFVLKEIAQLVKKRVRRTDLFARWGGEEFVILMPNINGLQGKIASSKLRDIIEQHSFSSEYITLLLVSE